jgi:hypothetical protein
MYRDVLADYAESAKLITADATLTAGEKANKLAIIDIMQVYTYSMLVNTFGNIPYTEALQPTNLFPKYDDAKTVHADLMARLNSDITKLNTQLTQLQSQQNISYQVISQLDSTAYKNLKILALTSSS